MTIPVTTSAATTTEVSPVHPPWYRQPWVWFVIALPATSVVASLGLVTISVIYKDDLVRDDWYKAGRAINQDIHADQHARELGLSGELTLDPAALTVSIRVQQATGEQPWPQRLQLNLIHSTLASEDMTVLLSRDAAGNWTGSLPRLPMGKRQLVLEPMPEAGAAAAAVAGEDRSRWRLRATDVVFQGVPVGLQPLF